MKLALLASLALGVNASDSIGKVVTLLENLKKEVETNQSKEGTAYDKFACFCKKNTDKKSDKIIKKAMEIDTEKADLETAVAIIADETKTIADKTAETETAIAEDATAKAQYDKDHATLTATILDLTKANNGLKLAIKAMTNANKDSLDSFLAVKQEVRRHLMLAEAMGLKSFNKEAKAFLQRPTNDNNSNRNFQSGGIVSILEELRKDFSDNLDSESQNRKALEDAENKRKLAHNDNMAALKNALATAESNKADGETRKGEATKALTEANESLQNAKTYLTSMTEECELRARVHDQKDAMMTNEISALANAIKIIGGAKKDSTDRAFLNQESKKISVKKTLPTEESASFVQIKSARSKVTTHRNLLAVQKNQKIQKVLSMVSESATALKSVSLYRASVALKTAGTFDKVKKLIQQLIERLYKEAEEEATQEGYCNTETAKAEKQREYKANEVDKLTTKLGDAKTSKAQKELRISELKDELVDTRLAQQDQSDARDADKKNNLATIKDAQEGRDGIAQALQVLSDFYKGVNNAGGADSATVSFFQQTPYELEAQGERDYKTTATAYQGSQDQAGGIMTILQVIHDDFDKQYTETMADEKEAQAEWVKADRANQVAIKAAETEKDLLTADVDKLTVQINEDMDSLQKNMGMVDDAVKTLEALNPLCVNTGMSAEERADKRDAEITALKKALAQLQPQP